MHETPIHDRSSGTGTSDIHRRTSRVPLEGVTSIRPRSCLALSWSGRVAS